MAPAGSRREPPVRSPRSTGNGARSVNPRSHGLCVALTVVCALSCLIVDAYSLALIVVIPPDYRGELPLWLVEEQALRGLRWLSLLALATAWLSAGSWRVIGRYVGVAAVAIFLGSAALLLRARVVWMALVGS